MSDFLSMLLSTISKTGSPAMAPPAPQLASADSLLAAPIAPPSGSGLPAAPEAPSGLGMLMPPPTTAPVASNGIAAMPGVSATPDNQYTPYDNAPEDLNKGEDITVYGDTWQPKKEDLLGQIGDWFTQGLFRARTKQANIKDAMRGFQDNPHLAISRVAKVDPALAEQMASHFSTIEANQALAKDRQVALQEKGISRIAGMLNALPERPEDRAKAYETALPVLRNWEKMYGLPEGFMSDKLDEAQVKAMINGEMSPYQQRSLSITQQNADRMEQHQQTSDNLAKQRLSIEAYNAETSRQNADTNTDYKNIARDDKWSERLKSRYPTYARALNEGAGWLEDKFPYGTTPNYKKVYTSPDNSAGVRFMPDGTIKVYDMSKYDFGNPKGNKEAPVVRVIAPYTPEEIKKLTGE